MESVLERVMAARAVARAAWKAWLSVADCDRRSVAPCADNAAWPHVPQLTTTDNRCLATGLATALWTFSSYGRLEAERVN